MIRFRKVRRVLANFLVWFLFPIRNRLYQRRLARAKAGEKLALEIDRTIGHPASDCQLVPGHQRHYARLLATVPEIPVSRVCPNDSIFGLFVKNDPRATEYLRQGYSVPGQYWTRLADAPKNSHANLPARGNCPPSEKY